MSAIATCSNCQAKFTDPRDVEAILSAAPHVCTSCASFAAAHPVEPQAPADEPEAEPAESAPAA